MNNVASLTKAYALAAQWHARQRRKGDAEEPYVNHLTEVAHLVACATGGEDINLAIAAVLHDAIEDAEITAEQIEAEFGEDVTQLVLAATDDKSLPYDERKRLQVETTPHKSPRAKVLKVADKTANVRSLATSPPQWPLERKLEYVAWSKRVVAGARGVNAELEAAFDAAAAEAERVLRGGALNRSASLSSAGSLRKDES
jgi:GTP diphosphokinase / guanosine-3',5'-bis(diphosphate) 3'-diphosphatase